MLKSGYTVDQTWKGLKKAWLGYTIAKNKGEDNKLVYYASVIQKLQKELGYTTGIANFPHLDTDEHMTKEKSNRSEKKLDTADSQDPTIVTVQITNE